MTAEAFRSDAPRSKPTRQPCEVAAERPLASAAGGTSSAAHDMTVNGNRVDVVAHELVVEGTRTARCVRRRASARPIAAGPPTHALQPPHCQSRNLKRRSAYSMLDGKRGSAREKTPRIDAGPGAVGTLEGDHEGDAATRRGDVFQEPAIRENRRTETGVEFGLQGAVRVAEGAQDRLSEWRLTSCGIVGMR